MQLAELSAQDRVQLHPGTDLWMRGARYGTITEKGRKLVRVRLDRLSKLVLLRPEDIIAVVN